MGTIIFIIIIVIIAMVLFGGGDFGDALCTVFAVILGALQFIIPLAIMAWFISLFLN